MIECPRIDRDQMEMDDSGYWFLIRPNFQQGVIEVAVCHQSSKLAKHVTDVYYGANCQDIYYKILRERPFVNFLTHAAYLGKELKKAEIALAIGLKDFYQE